MKKIIALVAAAALSATAAFAENTMHLGLGIPISSFTVSDSSASSHEYDVTVSGCDFAFDYTHVADGGFTFKVGFDSGYTTTSVDYGSKPTVTFDINGADFAFGFGFGGSPIHNERMTLSILGDFGLRIQSMSEEKNVLGYDTKFSLVNVLFYIGPEASFTFRFNDHIGVFGNFGIFYNSGVGIWDVTVGGSTMDDDTYSATGITFQPKFGLAVTF